MGALVDALLRTSRALLEADEKAYIFVLLEKTVYLPFTVCPSHLHAYLLHSRYIASLAPGAYRRPHRGNTGTWDVP